MQSSGADIPGYTYGAPELRPAAVTPGAFEALKARARLQLALWTHAYADDGRLPAEWSRGITL